MLERRDFLTRGGIAAAILGISPAYAEQYFNTEAPALPPRSLYDTDQERYWAELRRQWLLAPDRMNLNCGSVGCTPLPVLRAMIDHILSAESYREGPYPWFGYEENTRLRELRDALSAFIGCKRDELALVRNATEANNVVCNGLDLKAGDEVLLSDQEHPGGRCCYEQRAARHGIKLNFVALPKPPASKQQIVELFERALTPRTRVMMFSHITTVTGTILPVKELSALARSRGVWTHVDGAHVIGQLPMNLHDMGCDFYASSPHKWLMAPKGTGFLYVREELCDKLWGNTVSGEWKNYDMKAYRFSNFGTSNLSVMVGLKAALDFFQAIGPERIYKRGHELATRVRDRIAKYPQLKIVNASSDEFFGTLVSFEPATGVAGAPKDLSRIAQQCAARNIRIGGGGERIRIATHIFTQPTELNAFFDAVDAGLRI